MGNNDNEMSAKDWFLRYILPIIIIPLLSSGFVCYGTIQKVDNQIVNNEKRIGRIETNDSITRVEFSKINGRVSKLEVLCENINKSLDRIAKRDSSIDKQLRSINESVVVLKDRQLRDDVKTQ